MRNLLQAGGYIVLRLRNNRGAAHAVPAKDSGRLDVP